MNNDTVELPWPLNETFLLQAYNPSELQFQVYYAALGERTSFLRYALFYGLYFNQCKTKLSYVQHYGEDETDAYNLLRLLGVTKKRFDDKMEVETITQTKEENITVVSILKPDRVSIQEMFLCPYRYFLDRVLNPTPVGNNEFLYLQLYENIIIKKVCQDFTGRRYDVVERELLQYISECASKFSVFWGFLQEADRLNIVMRAYNYILGHVLNRDNHHGIFQIEDNFLEHMTIRCVMGEAFFSEEITTESVKRRPEFEKLIMVEDNKKIYSLNRVRFTREIIKDVERYINESKENESLTGEWCNFCGNKDLCLKPYLMSTDDMSG